MWCYGANLKIRRNYIQYFSLLHEIASWLVLTPSHQGSIRYPGLLPACLIFHGSCYKYKSLGYRIFPCQYVEVPLPMSFTPSNTITWCICIMFTVYTKCRLRDRLNRHSYKMHFYRFWNILEYFVLIILWCPTPPSSF